LTTLRGDATVCGVTDARVERLQRRFALLDRDGDGTVGEDDYALLGERLTAAAGLDREDAVGVALRASVARLWRAVSADGEAVTLERWLAAVASRDADDSFGQALDEVVRTALVAFDPGGSGTWDADEFDRYAQAQGMTERATEEAFRRLDRDGTGRLTYTDLLRWAREFYEDDDDGPGAWLFGPPGG
jgi:Ca2+-binding EF-hand superfamily protein